MITFTVAGYVEQLIIPIKGYTEEQVVCLLNEGKAVTSLHLHHILLFCANGEEVVIAHIDDTNNLCEYQDFEVV